jgi:hypothetical protein
VVTVTVASGGTRVCVWGGGTNPAFGLLFGCLWWCFRDNLGSFTSLVCCTQVSALTGSHGLGDRRLRRQGCHCGCRRLCHCVGVATFQPYY